jgi:periplasmic protein TonB
MDSFCELRQCLVDSDPEALRHDRSVRRVGLAASFALQTAAVAILILVPLLAPVVVPRFATVNAVPVWRPPAPVRVEQPSQPARALSAPQYIPNGVSRPNPTVRQESADTGQAIGLDFGAPREQGDLSDVLGTSRTYAPVRPITREGSTHPLAVGSGVMEAMLIKRVEPKYPTMALNTHTSGSVVLSAVIATDGTIQSLKVVSGNPLLLGAALAAVREWRYKPTLLDGQPVEVETLITVNFVLQE